jgi:hypothetical protein
MRIHHIVICDLPRCTEFSTSCHKRHDFRKKATEHKNVCFDFLYTFCLQHFSFWKEMSEIWSKVYIDPHVKYPLFLSGFMTRKFSQQMFEKSSNIKFHENLSSGSRVDPYGRTDMTKLIVAFRNFAEAPKKEF